MLFAARMCELRERLRLFSSAIGRNITLLAKLADTRDRRAQKLGNDRVCHLAKEGVDSAAPVEARFMCVGKPQLLEGLLQASEVDDRRVVDP